jgi:signal transduction histidine kinase
MEHASLIAALLLPVSLVWGVRQHALRRAAEQGREIAEAGSQRVLRLLRLAASEMREQALALIGHADRAGPLAEPLSRLSTRLALLAEDLSEQGAERASSPNLREEVFPLAPVLDMAVGKVAASLGPATRGWRLAPRLGTISLRADRRAVHQILASVLASAAAATRDRDFIEIGTAERDGAWVITVQDEGRGLPVSDAEANGPEDRGIGFGLALARRLMQAHGGSLTVESAAQIGTRVVLAFPPERVLTEP